MTPSAGALLTRPDASGPSADEVLGAIRHETGPLPQLELAYEADIQTLWVTLRPEPKPVVTYVMVDSLQKLQRAIWSLWRTQQSKNAWPVRFLAYRAKGPIYTLGGDLDFYLDCLAKADRKGIEHYAQLSSGCLLWNSASLYGAAITLATVHNKAFGGGIDGPNSCNVMVAEQPASFCYPEIKFNHFPMIAASVLTRRVGPRNALRIISSGEKYTAEQFQAMGGLEAVTPAGEGENWLRKYARETLPIYYSRMALFRTFFQHGGDLEAEIQKLVQTWADGMMRLSPMQISKLQRIVQVQERMLQSEFAAA